jgi:hypothetical protein
MSQPFHPYDSLLDHFRQHLSGPDSQLVNLALWVYGLFKARSCHLGRVADELPLEGKKESIIRRSKRWVMNPRLVPESLYRKLIAQWLAHWPDGKELVLIFDRTEVADRFNVLMLAVGFRGRAIPLTWDILSHKGACCFAEQKKLLDRIEPSLPTQAHIALMGDSEFRSVRLFRYASLRDWDYALGHKGDTLIFREDLQRWQRLDELPVKPGKPIYLEGILLTQKYRFGPTNLIAFWDDEDDCVRYRITNRPANGFTFQWTRIRSWIEGLFRDYKSGGFQLDKTRLEHPDRLDHLLLVMAIAMLWFVAIGRRLVKMGLRQEIDSARKRAHTYFQIGWSWLKKQVRLQRPLPFSLHVYT